jgi:DNA-directed RNA polymerase specialized sigma subunit
MEIGTMADNMNDKVARGRQTRGAQHYVAKLNEHQVTVIHELRAEGLTHREISAVAGCGGAQVSRILSGKSWSHFVVANQ